MSNIYHTEPPTQGKVLLKTSYGDIDIELWSKEAPLACRNFIQLALEGYYDNSAINRVIKDFMVQFGDPSGTGSGGESIWGRPFKDEVHGRLLFNHRGQLAMANENTPNSNKSQFFVTLGACEWLNRKHTIFGKVTGDTIYNLLRMGESDIGDNDRPAEPIQLLGVEVLWNPFDDIVLRDIKKVEVIVPINSKDEAKKKRKGTKDLKLLSFGDEEGEGEGGGPDDVIQKKKRNVDDVKIKIDKVSGSNKRSSKVDRLDDEDEDEVLIKKTNQIKELKASQKFIFEDQEDDDVIEELEDKSAEAIQNKLIKEKGAEYQKLKEGLLRSQRAVKVITGADAAQIREETAFKDLITPLEQRRLKYIKKKTEFGSRQDETFAKLQQFTSSIRTNKNTTKEIDASHDIKNKKVSNSLSNKKIEILQNSDKDENVIDKIEKSKDEEFDAYNGQILDHDSDDNDILGNDWHSGKLKFRKHVDDKLRKKIGGDGRSIDDYEVIDSRGTK